MIRALGCSRGVLVSSFKALAVPRKGMAVLAAVSAVKNLDAQVAANPYSDALKMATDGAKPVKYSCPLFYTDVLKELKAGPDAVY